MPLKDDILARIEQFKQQKLLEHLKKLSSDKLEKLQAQLQSLDWASLEALLIKKITHALTHTPFFEPVAPYRLSEGAQREREVGEKLIREGKLGLFIVAGGQGSRLGFEGPKGCFGVTPVRKQSLFGVFAEKILAAQRCYGVTFPWVFMTSQQNNAATKSFFKENKYFGLKEDQLFFFIQGMLPAIDSASGQMLLGTEDSLLLAPNGTGGSFNGLHESGALKWLGERGVKTLSYFAVDNPLVNIVDPIGLGAHAISESEYTIKSISKLPNEKVGVVAKKNGKMAIVEYIELPPVIAESHDDNGNFVYAEGNTGIGLIDLSLVEKAAAHTAMPFHRAHKKETYWDGEKIVTPASPNAYKFERFVFDALPIAKNPIVFRVERAEEFYPVKNAEGVDSPKTSLEAQLRLWVKWLKAMGVAVPADADGLPTINFEITPLFADNQQALEGRAAKGQLPKEIKNGTVLAAE